ncbi:hypothetical protein [Streptomyces geysiriensis]|uniref:hypothetical protein n=1 Tax=Streptomyces geysiriensis TaxID=68207 RepID=UPI001C7D762E|nr:hypothetical protein [Streptomyces geysiriensis]MBX4175583.1 hypothetical protein [Streptomyces geysiriensis]
MARIRIWIDPQHRDGAVCEHAIAPSRKSRDPIAGCTGRARYQVMCSEHGAVAEPHGLRELAESTQTAHCNDHKAALARPAA